MPNQTTQAYQLGYRDGINGSISSSPFKKNGTTKEDVEYQSGYAAGSAVAARRRMGVSPNMR